MSKTYIHYGSTKFDATKGFPIRNERLWIKPKGGLWASPVNASWGWKQWCEVEEFRECTTSNSFMFTIVNDANIATLNSMHDINALPLLKEDPRFTGIFDKAFIDFEECLKRGIDAIELCWYGDEYSDVKKDDLHHALYGWDCDSIVILNPEVVIQMEK